MNKQNKYYLNRKAIRTISEEKNVEISTACAMYRHEQGWDAPEGDKEITAFCAEFNRVKNAALSKGGNRSDIENFWNQGGLTYERQI